MAERNENTQCRRSNRQYKKRTNMELCRLHSEVQPQSKADLDAMARGAGRTVGWVIDELVGREVRRRARRMKIQDVKLASPAN